MLILGNFSNLVQNTLNHIVPYPAHKLLVKILPIAWTNALRANKHRNFVLSLSNLPKICRPISPNQSCILAISD
ncbi:hypothetical protein [Moraxella lacunata]|uniref:hypothetical protein n=1 Tax=Moraxella lacunata TaxID=477 RepID=UPI003EE3167A